MACWRVVCAALSLATFVAAGDAGPCRYEDAYCSCKLGAPDQGRCWDRIAGSLGFCRQRPCARGWTCACAGRSHLCARAPQSVNTVEADVERLPEAPCTQQVVYQVTKPTLRLGSFLPALSASGMARDECSQFTWWHNGLLRGDWGLVGGVMDENKTATALSERGVHTLLELRPGDLLAFQFTHASYYCYKSFSAIMVNGLNITTDMPGVATHYARQATPNWFGPAYVIDESNTAADESDTDLTKWLKPRTKMLVDNATIVPGRDQWQRDLGGSDDTRTADWFWRVQIPRDLPDPQTASF